MKVEITKKILGDNCNKSPKNNDYGSKHTFKKRTNSDKQCNFFLKVNQKDEKTNKLCLVREQQEIKKMSQVW